MAHSMLLVMDMINDLMHPDGPGGQTYVVQGNEKGVVANIGTAIRRARKAGMPIAHVRIGFSPDYRECPEHSPVFAKARENGLFQLGTWGTKPHPDIAPQEGDFDIVKHRISPFYGTHLEPILRAQGVQRLILCGVSTNGVVQAAAREGHDRDYACVLLEDCCCGATPTEHEHAIAGLREIGLVEFSTAEQFET
jgi:nicotinamidase-related amidase